MNKYWFKVKAQGCTSSARIQVVVWADTSEEAFDEVSRIYGDTDPEIFQP